MCVLLCLDLQNHRCQPPPHSAVYPSLTQPHNHLFLGPKGSKTNMLQNNLANTGPANEDSLHQALATQGVLVGQHEKVLQDVVETLRGLLVVQCLTSWQLPQSPSAYTPAPPVSAPSACELIMHTPECYSRDLAAYGRFLIQLPLQAWRNPFNLVEHIYSMSFRALVMP